MLIKGERGSRGRFGREFGRGDSFARSGDSEMVELEEAYLRMR